jgi:hypothetical protein
LEDVLFEPADDEFDAKGAAMMDPRPPVAVDVVDAVEVLTVELLVAVGVPEADVELEAGDLRESALAHRGSEEGRDLIEA